MSIQIGTRVRLDGTPKWDGMIAEVVDIEIYDSMMEGPPFLVSNVLFDIMDDDGNVIHEGAKVGPNFLRDHLREGTMVPVE